LKVNFSWTLAGNVIYAGCQWGILVVLAKLGSPEMVGQFALGVAVNAPIFMFTNLQLRAVQATDARGEYAFADYFGLRLTMTLLALLVNGVIVLAAGFKLETALVVLSYGLAKALESLSDVFYGLCQRHERMDRIAKSMMIKGPLALAAMLLGVCLTGSVYWGVLGLAGGWLLLLVGYDIRSGVLILGLNRLTAARLRPRWELRHLLKLAWLVLPLGLVQMLVSLNGHIPRYFVQWHLGERDLGIISALAYISMAGITVVMALGQSATPRLANYYADKNRAAFSALLLKLVGLCSLMAVAGMVVALVAGREVLAILYGPEYSQHKELFVWIMAVAGVQYITVFGFGMTAARYFRPQLPLYALEALVTAAACLWLVPRFGLLGAVMASGLAMVIHFVGSLTIVLHALGRISKGRA